MHCEMLLLLREQATPTMAQLVMVHTLQLIAGDRRVNKVFVDEANNRISFFTEIAGAAVEQIRVQDGAIVPVTDDDIDLGAVGAEFKNLYIDGTANIDALISAAVTSQVAQLMVRQLVRPLLPQSQVRQLKVQSLQLAPSSLGMW
jgi:hypothetical protein